MAMAEARRRSGGSGLLIMLVVLLGAQLCVGDDIVHDDSEPPKQPGCENNFVLVRL